MGVVGVAGAEHASQQDVACARTHTYVQNRLEAAKAAGEPLLHSFRSCEHVRRMRTIGEPDTLTGNQLARWGVDTRSYKRRVCELGAVLLGSK